MNSRIYTLTDVATQLNVSKKSVRRWLKAGSLPEPLDLPGYPRWSAEVFDAWLAGEVKKETSGYATSRN